MLLSLRVCRKFTRYFANDHYCWRTSFPLRVELMPNAGGEPRARAAARHERRLLRVGSSAWLGAGAGTDTRTFSSGGQLIHPHHLGLQAFAPRGAALPMADRMGPPAGGLAVIARGLLPCATLRASAHRFLRPMA